MPSSALCFNRLDDAARQTTYPLCSRAASLVAHSYRLVGNPLRSLRACFYALIAQPRGTPFALLLASKEGRMNLSAICHKCGNIAAADYGADLRIFDTADTGRTKTRRIVMIHCPACGDHERLPHCQSDLTDTGILRLLVL